MNSYNENLHSTVVNSLQAQELDLKTVDAETNASMFALYYAQDATFSAYEKLEEAKTKQQNAEVRKKQALDNSNISVNLLSSAKQSNQYLQQSISNTAVAASNVQVAANAILKLASDIGSVYNIVQAADFDTDIARSVSEANGFITQSAYDAELASQIAMDASILTAQVPGATLQDKARNTNNSMNDLVKIISADYDAKSQAVATANASLASDSINEKQAEGAYEDISVMYRATGSAYDATNKELNLDLTAVPEEGNETTNFTVSFDWIRSPFPEENKPALFPVQNYYLIIVKDKQKNTFSIHDAENIIRNEGRRFINLDGIIIPPSPEQLIKQERQGPIITKYPTPSRKTPIITKYPSPLRLQPIRHHFEGTFNYLQITNNDSKQTYVLQDSDGDDITTGIKYTVFVMAVYTEDYKKRLNTFDDFLSAPSPHFMLSYKLAIATLEKPEKQDSEKKQDNVKKKDSEKKDDSQTIFFTVSENPDYADIVEYRCILLPLLSSKPNTDPIVSDEANNMVTTSSLKELDTDIAELKKIALQIDPEIATLNADFIAKETQIQVLEQKHHFLEFIEQWVKKMENKFRPRLIKSKGERTAVEEIAKEYLVILKHQVHKGMKKPTGFIKNVDSASNDVIEFIILILLQLMDQWKIMDLAEQREKIIDKLKMSNDSKIGFLFNLTLAEQVSPGNYTPAKPIDADNLEPAPDFVKTNPPLHDIDVPKKKTGKGSKGKQENDNWFPAAEWKVPIAAGTTDNFGNLLVNDQLYIPVILSISTAPEENLSKFSNQWTGYDTTNYFRAIVK